VPPLAEFPSLQSKYATFASHIVLLYEAITSHNAAEHLKSLTEGLRELTKTH